MTLRVSERLERKWESEIFIVLKLLELEEPSSIGQLTREFLIVIVVGIRKGETSFRSSNFLRQHF